MYFSNFLLMFWYETIHPSAVVSYGRAGAGSCGEGFRDRAEVCEWCGVPDLATRQGGNLKLRVSLLSRCVNSLADVSVQHES